MPEATLREYKRSRRYFSPLVVFLFCAALTAGVWYLADQASSTENSARFDRWATTLLNSFRNRMTVYTNSLIYTRNLISLKPDLSAEEFQKFVRGMNLEKEYPGIQTIGYVKRVRQAELPKLLRQLPEKSRQLIHEKKDRYDVVKFVESMVNNPRNAIGMDLSASAERAETMNLAARLGRPVATDRVIPITMATTNPAEYFFLVFVPQYQSGMPLDTPEQRSAAASGFVYGGFRAAGLFGNIAGDARTPDKKLNLKIYDGPKVDPQNLMFTQGDPEGGAPIHYKEIELQTAEHEWTIQMTAMPGFDPMYSRVLPLLVLFIGTVLTIAVTLSVIKAQKFAHKLQEDIEIRRRAEAQLSEEKQIVELAAKIGTTLKAEQDLESIVQAVTDVATSLTAAKFGAFFYNTFNENGEALTLFSLSGADRADFAKFGMPRKTDVFKSTFEGTGVMRVDDITKDPRYGKMAPHHGMPKGHLPVRSYLSVPVMSRNGAVLGGLFFGHPEPGVFTARAEALVIALAIQAGVAMDNANLYRELSQARTAADAANRAKSLFLANVSHEIRTPLGLMLGFAELTAEHKNDSAAVEENIKKILRSGRELTRIIGEVLDLSKIEANALLIENSTFSLSHFIDELQAEWQPQVEAKKLRFELERGSGLPAELHTDSTRLTQIIVNMLSNALKFTDRGRIRLRFDTHRSDEGKDFVTVTVEDSGLGISEENKSRLFKTFSQGDASINRRFGGSGLGLALSKQLAQALGGDLKLSTSTLGTGSTFKLCIPVRRENADKASSASIKSQSPRLSLDSVRVLLVEDSIDNQILITAFLKKLNAIVETANNGEEGVQKALSGSYDIVLMDIQMPVLDGYGAFEKLKAAGFTKPVIALTAHALVAEKERAAALGFHDYLTKPLNRQSLINAIAEAVT